MKSDSDIKNIIRSLIAQILNVDKNRVPENADFVQDLGMDSMMALEILAGIEKEFKIVIPEELMVEIASIEKASEAVKKLISPR